MSKQITIVPKRVWVWFHGKSVRAYGYPAITFQHRIAWPPAEYQTCHHTIMLINGWKPHYRKDIV